MPITPIDDLADQRLDDYRNVPDPELLARRGVFVAEGRLVVARLIEQSVLEVRSVLVTETARRALAQPLAKRPDVDVYLAPQAVVRGVTGMNIHRGCLAIGTRPAPRPWQTVVDGARRLVVLERVGNADNMGGIFRNAAAFGVDAVLLGPDCVDPLYRKAIRTSMGAALRVPFARVDRWPDMLTELRDRAFTMVALSPSAPTSLEAIAHDLAPSAPIALVLGHEGDGLTPAARDACTRLAAIRMSPGADSVNVAAAAAIALYELYRPD